MAVVFGPDTFTVAADINIDAYPSGSPDYAYEQGTGSDLTVNAANDRVQQTLSTGVWIMAYITEAAANLVDQEITATIGPYANSQVGLMVRRTTGFNGYMVTVSGGTVLIDRWHNGNVTGLTTAARGLNAAIPHTMRFKVTGSGATVSLEAQVDATAVVTFGDTDANRKLGPGPPGLIVFSNVANDTYWDNVSVDNLVSAAPQPAPYRPRAPRVRSGPLVSKSRLRVATFPMAVGPSLMPARGVMIQQAMHRSHFF